MTASRLNYEESCRFLQQHGYLEAGELPPIPAHLPQYDDPEPLGVSFFRTLISDEVPLNNLTLARTFFGRSELDKACFRNTDLTESNLCWNDFLSVDFTWAILAKADMRSSQFVDVTFVAADLREADMRRSSFERCTFSGAMLDRARLTKDQGRGLSLTRDQREAIDWQKLPGNEPGGG
jgi:uncharacterized protein YjbI with pentapeptide repeats